jgi:hypothetical protein
MTVHQPDRDSPTSLAERIRSWYRGTYVPPPPNHPDSLFVIISPGHYEQPVLARLLGIAGLFWLRHWQWIIGTALAVLAIFVAL